VTGTLNGKTALLFNGSNSAAALYISIANLGGIDIANPAYPCTIVITHGKLPDNGHRTFFSGISSAGNWRLQANGWWDSIHIPYPYKSGQEKYKRGTWNNGTSEADGGFPYDKAYVTTALHTGSSVTLYDNSVKAPYVNLTGTRTNRGIGNYIGLGVCCGNPGYTSNWGGGGSDSLSTTMGDIIFFNRAATDDERGTAETFLQRKFSL